MGRKRIKPVDERPYFKTLANIINSSISETAFLPTLAERSLRSHIHDAFTLMGMRLEQFAGLRPEHAVVLSSRPVFGKLFTFPQYLSATQIRDTLTQAVERNTPPPKPKTPVQLVAEAIFKVAQRKPQ